MVSLVAFGRDIMYDENEGKSTDGHYIPHGKEERRHLMGYIPKSDVILSGSSTSAYSHVNTSPSRDSCRLAQSPSSMHVLFCILLRLQYEPEIESFHYKKLHEYCTSFGANNNHAGSLEYSLEHRS